MVEINEDNLVGFIGTDLCIVDFESDSCSPCKVQKPILEELYDDNVKVGSINIDNNYNAATDHQITSLPTIIFFKDGEEKKRLVGLQSKEAILDVLMSIS